MGITYGDHLIDSGYYDITPEQERKIEIERDCELCGGDCSAANPPIWNCPLLGLDNERHKRAMVGGV